ncbi:hypothetical protein D3C71_1340740 [compost metagenome]
MTQTKTDPKTHYWVTLSESDHHTTSAMSTGYGAVVKNQSFEQRKIDGMNIAVQISESMVYVPNVKVEQVEEQTSDGYRNVWVLTPHFPK